MPVVSIFLPDEGLQGEDIPSHIIWRNMNYRNIRINLPPFLKLKEIYNVNEDQYEIIQNDLFVNEVEVDGFLGLLFESARSNTEKEEVGETSYQFLNTENQFVFQTKKTIHLYRPFVFMESVPSSIKIDFTEKKIDNKIKINNTGKGTAILEIKTTEKSDIHETTPAIIQDFLDEFIKDLDKEIDRLKGKYPSYSPFLDKLSTFEEDPSYDEVEELFDEFERIIEKDGEFVSELANSFAWCIMNNIHMETIVESFVSYLNSLATTKILLFNPIEVIEVSEKPRRIDLKISQKDFLMKDYEPIEIPPIEISANTVGNIELHKLFEWGNDNES